MALTMLGILIGCDGGPKDKVVVVGEISYQGKRVMNGDVRYFPIPPSVGPATGNAIVDGTYRIDRNGGVPVGKHTVVIRAFVLEGVLTDDQRGTAIGDGMIASNAARSQHEMPQYMAEGRPNFLPPQYNHASQLTAEITGEEDPQTVDFSLD